MQKERKACGDATKTEERQEYTMSDKKKKRTETKNLAR